MSSTSQLFDAGLRKRILSVRFWIGLSATSSPPISTFWSRD
jgi:hypothetical protein